jgi:hypothetical protein
MTPIKRYLLILLFIGIGIGFGIGFGAIFYNIRKKKDDEITFGDSVKNIIIPSIFFWLTIGILIILKCEYCISLQIFIMSGIILASFLSAITTKAVWMFFLGLGVVITEIGLNHLIKRIIEYINCKVEHIKASKKPISEIEPNKSSD